MKPEDTTGNRSESSGSIGRACKDWLMGFCNREPCRFVHEPAPVSERRGFFYFCHDFQNKGCARPSCRFVHCSVEDEMAFMRDGVFPPQTPAVHRPLLSVQPFNWPPPQVAPFFVSPESDGQPGSKLMRFSAVEDLNETQCPNCIVAEHNVKRVHENYNVLLKKYNELKQENTQLTSMNEFLLEQTASREREGTIAITSRASTPVSVTTVSMTPVVSLSELVPPGGPSALTLDVATSRAQILTQAPQLITHNAGALIVTSTGAHQLMQASAPATLVGGAQAVVAVTPAQLVASPSSATVQQLVQHSAQLAVAQQSAQHLVAQQSAQNLAAAAQQSLAAAQQSAQQLAVAQQSQLTQQTQHVAHQNQQLVHPSSAQMTMTASLTQAPSHFPMISQSIMPH